MTFEGESGGGMDDFRKNILKSDFEHKKNLARKYLPYNSFVCQGKVFYHQRFGGKNSYAKPLNHPYPAQSQIIIF